MSNQYFHKRLLDNLTTAVLLLDEDLDITYLNPSAEILFETSSKSICGQNISVLFSQEDEDTASELKAVFESGHPFTKREAVIQCVPHTGTGKQLTVNYSVSMIQEAGQNKYLMLELNALDRLLKISRDEATLHNQQATKVLLRGVAHEVKNPLGGIKGAAQLLLREIENPDQKEYIQVVIDEADRLRSLVDRMLGPRNIPEIQAYNIHEVLEHTAHLAEADVGDKVEIIRDYDPSIPDILVDRDQLIQASLNILSNACQALVENDQQRAKILIRTRILRQFTIASKRHKMVVKIDFIDNGPGIPEEIRDALFYPMVSGRAQGTGLGLSIAQSIVNQFEGIIECESEPGETCFSILLPINQDESFNQTEIRYEKQA